MLGFCSKHRSLTNQQSTTLSSLDKYYPPQYKLLISLKAFKSYTMVCIYGYEQPIICNLTLPSLVNVHPLVMGKNYNLNKHTNSTVFLLLTSDNVPNTKDSHFSLYSSEVSETRDLNINGSYRKRLELSVHIVNLCMFLILYKA